MAASAVQKPKLYIARYLAAPNPRRVLVYLAEAGISPSSLEIIQLDMNKKQHKRPEYLRNNPAGKLPFMVLPDGTTIAESLAVCRYLDAIRLSGLFGGSAVEQALVEQWNRQLDIDLFHTSLGVAWLNSPILSKSRGVELTSAQLERRSRSVAAVIRFYSVLDTALRKSPFLAGERYTTADITAMCHLDFAENLVGIPVDRAELPALAKWLDTVRARPSANAHVALKNTSKL